MSARPGAREGDAMREVAARARLRLNLLEWGALAGAAVAAALGGALVAFLLAPVTGISARTLWIVVSLAVFALPGGAVLVRVRKEERAERARRSRNGTRSDG